MGHPLPHFKSIEGSAGEVSVHQMACHFNSLHFLGRNRESLSKMFVIRLQGNRLSIFRRLRERKYAENLLS